MMRLSSGTKAIPAAEASCARMRCNGLFSSQISPWRSAGLSKRAIARKVEVFPAPLRPKRARISPSLMSKLTPWTI